MRASDSKANNHNAVEMTAGGRESHGRPKGNSRNTMCVHVRARARVYVCVRARAPVHALACMCLLLHIHMEAQRLTQGIMLHFIFERATLIEPGACHIV